MGVTFKGTRRDCPTICGAGWVLQPGEYGKWGQGWWCCPMEEFHGCLTGHAVVEHEDGTISVSPSILITRGDGKQWHGFLERGVWRHV